MRQFLSKIINLKKFLIIKIFIFSFLILLFLSLISKTEYINKYLKNKLDSRLFAILQVFGDINTSSKKLNNDYNIQFLPKTLLIDLDLIKIDLSKNFTKEEIFSGYLNHLKIKINQTFYIDTYNNNNIIFLTKSGQLFFNDYEAILQNKKLKKNKYKLKLN